MVTQHLAENHSCCHCCFSSPDVQVPPGIPILSLWCKNMLIKIRKLLMMKHMFLLMIKIRMCQRIYCRQSSYSHYIINSILTYLCTKDCIDISGDLYQLDISRGNHLCTGSAPLQARCSVNLCLNMFNTCFYE